MKFSVNWLRELVELPASVEELADLLTFAGVEIEGIERRGLDLDHVVVGQINASAQHPNADRLSVCEVDDGTNHKRQIVCGAKNYRVGDKVPVALPDASLPNGLKIKVSKLRGVESQGMLCSAVELGISEESDGLLILSPDAKIGAPIGSLFPPDTILDAEITPNRSDLLSYVGLAREIGALTGKAARLPEIATPATSASNSVRIAATRECPFFSARRIENITVRPSPDWLRAKLESAGIRSINNLVDIGNFVMLELGQPLHIFDAAKLQGGINVRLAQEGEKFLALDGKTYSLGHDMLMVTDDARAVGIAGVMGGEETGVADSTCNVLLESAYFLPASVRRTARTLNLPSDASYRFERGVDPAMTLRASARAAQLMTELADGKPAAETVVAGEVPAPPANVTLRYERSDQLLGVAVPRGEIKAALENLGLQLVEKSDSASTWKIPSYRPDLKREVDLIEEIVRVYGINKIPSRNRSSFVPTSAADRRQDRLSVLRRRLSGFGLFEIRTSTLIPRDAVPKSGAVLLKNPLSEDHVALRPVLGPGMLKVLSDNAAMGAQSIRLFEIGRVFVPPDAEEHTFLGIIVSGSSSSIPHWRSRGEELDFYHLKGVIDAMRVLDLEFRRESNPDYPVYATIRLGSELVGYAWLLPTTRAIKYGVASPVALAEIDLDRLFYFEEQGSRFRDLEKFPAIARDIAVIVPSSLTHAEIEAVIRGVDEPLLTEVQLFDRFIGSEANAIGAGRKSLAYTLTYRDQNRTLTHDEVNAVHNKIRERLKSELGAELRE